jgi:hypothetical protein
VTKIMNYFSQPARLSGCRDAIDGGTTYGITMREIRKTTTIGVSQDSPETLGRDYMDCCHLTLPQVSCLDDVILSLDLDS